MLTALMGAMVLGQFVPAGALVRPRPVVRPQVVQIGDAEVLGAIGARDANVIEVTTLAQTKASSAEVKAFAAQVLEAHRRSLTRSGELAKELGLSRELPPDSAMARAQVAAMDQMSALSGPAFDRAYMQYVAETHAAGIQKVTGTQAPAAQHPSVKAFVDSRLPELRAHHTTATAWLAANRP